MFALKVKAGAVTIECELAAFDVERDRSILFCRALDFIRAMVDLTAFSSGVGLSVVLDRFTDVDGTTVEIGPVEKTLPPICTAFSSKDGGASFRKVWEITLKDPRLFFVFRDLNEAITQPHMGPANCARAVERIRNIIATGQRDKGWAAFRTALNIDEAYVRFITETSRGPRHGDTAFIDGPTTRTVVERSWVLANRFLEYRKRGDVQLSLGEFPLLVG
jgi:hypothetical protein